MTLEYKCFFRCKCQGYKNSKEVGLSEVLEHISILDGTTHCGAVISIEDRDYPQLVVGGGVEDRVVLMMFFDKGSYWLNLVDPSFKEEFEQTIDGTTTVSLGRVNVAKDMAKRAVKYFVESGGEHDPSLMWVHDPDRMR